MAAIGAFFSNLWEILSQGGFYVLLGFLLAGMVYSLFKQKDLSRIFRGSAPVAALKGMLFGVPLPICSCGVVPITIALQRRGVPRSALMSFLIGTP
ncbi:MAG: permease, partial [Deltaproteobacteria bacterium]|nr:permease [Deltaproteobacteria bacterium]